MGTVCSQIRLRDCSDLNIMLFSASNPCIETSTNVNFYCHQFSYFSLLQQMDETKLCIFDNLWFNIRDFGVQERSEFQIKHNMDADQDTSFFAFLHDLPQNIHDEMQPVKQSIIPLTLGILSSECLNQGSYQDCVVFMIANGQEFIIESFRKLQQKVIDDPHACFIQMKTISSDHSVFDGQVSLDEGEDICIGIDVYLSR